MPASARWHLLTLDDTVSELNSDALRGLTRADAADRLARVGPNAIVEAERRSLLGILYRQFTDFMIIVLLVAAVISGFIAGLQDTNAIIVIVFLNAIIDAVQEYRAERAVAALRMNAVFKTQPLSLVELSVCFGLAALVLVAVELEKWLHRRG